MTTRLKAYLIKLSTNARARESFRKNPIGAMKRAKLSDADIIYVLSGKVADDKNSSPISLNIAVKTGPKIL